MNVLNLKVQRIVFFLIVFTLIMGMINCGDEIAEQLKKDSALLNKKQENTNGKKKRIVPVTKADNNDNVLPKYKDYVNDYADILSSENKEEIRMLLSGLKEEIGIHAALVTIGSLNDYQTGYNSAEDFTNALFAKWKIGKNKNNGFLILLSIKDLKGHITLGSKYTGYDNSKMVKLVDEKIIPSLKTEDSDGVFEEITKIIVELSTVNFSDTKINKEIDKTNEDKINQNTGLDIVLKAESADKLRYGIGIAGNQLNAFELYKKAASEGDVNAMVELAEYYEQGIWVKRDHKKSIQLLKKAAASGSLAAKWQLEFMEIKE